MSSPALDLIARMVAGQVAARPCSGCGGLLEGSRVGVQPAAGGAVLIRVECRACGERLVVAVEPETDDGVARVR